MRTRLLAAAGAVVCLALALTGSLTAVAVGWDFGQALEAFVVSNVVIGVSFGLCGALIAWHRPAQPIGWLLLAGGLLQTVTAAAGPLAQLVQDHGGPQVAVRALVTAFAFAWPVHIGVCLPLSLALLPDGRLPSARWRPWFLALALTSPLFVVEVGTTSQQLSGIPDGFWVLPRTDGWAALWALSEPRWVLSMLFGLTALVVRYRRGDEAVRRQLLWVVAAAAVVLVAVAPWSLVAGTPIAVLFALPLLPAGIAVAVLRHQLLDIRLVLARGVAYGLLSGLVLACYAVLVIVLSGVASALLVALLALPLRARLQTAVDRLLYGDRSDPVRVASHVGGHLGDLSAGLDAARASLRLPYLAVRAGEQVLADSGAPTAVRATRPLSESMSLVVGLRQGERVLSAADARVLDLLSGPLVVAVAATSASAELQLSRERIVTARAEERRRLRRDLHDGLGPLLTGVALSADAAANLGRSAPEEADALLRGVRADTRTAIAEVRRLVDDLRPGALDELGLVRSLEARAAQAVRRVDGAPLRVLVEAGPLPLLPAALEVAAYRIATEALTNAVRHSRATAVVVRLHAETNCLSVEVLDDGCAEPWGATGVGTTSMRERAEELGGSLRCGPTATGGAVRALLPLVVR